MLFEQQQLGLGGSVAAMVLHPRSKSLLLRTLV